MIAGRAAETARIEAVLRPSRGPAALLLLGEPGIGKTALLAYARRAATEHQVLTARGIEGEAHLAFAGLAELVRPLLPHLDALPAPQGAALRGALALGPPAAPDRFATYSAVLGLLSLGSRAHPLLLLIDDLHWFDAPSAEAVLFCARRLGDAPVTIIAAARPEELGGRDTSGMEPLVVPPLGVAPARRVLLAGGGPPPAPASVDRLLAAAAGNPLALVELRSLIAADGWPSELPAGPIPAGELVTRAFSRRVQRLPERTRRALVVAAVGDGRLGPLAAALASRGLALTDLQPAEPRVIALGPDRLSFDHPLLRNVVVSLADPVWRRAAHRALAEALVAPEDAAGRAVHLAEATLGPDEEVAAALETAAAETLPRTGFAAAAVLLERAAALTPGPGAARDARVLAAGAAAQLAGHDTSAAELLTRCMRTTGDPLLRARAAHSLGLLHTWRGPLDTGHRILTEEAERVRPVAPPLAALLFAAATVTRTLAGDARAALRAARRAVASSAEADPSLRVLANAVLAWALVVGGEGRAAAALLDAAAVSLDAVDPLTPEGQLLVITALARLWTGRADDAEQIVARCLGAARDAGAAALVGHYLVIRSEVALHRGRVAEARADASEAVPLLESSGQRTVLAYCLGRLAQAEAILGEDAAVAHAARATALADELDVGSARFVTGAASGSLALARDRPAEAVAHLAPIERRAIERGVREPLSAQWQADLVEAYVRVGDVAAARAALRRLAEDAGRTGGAWARAVTARSRGLLDADHDGHFRRALTLHGLAPNPYDHGRTALAYGRRLRHSGRRREARARLHEALSAFARIGARDWIARVHDELAALGEQPRPVTDPGHDLSPRELQVAREAARGATNAEVAARLFISDKTVERHLGAVYRKLKIRNRSELAWRLARSGDGADGREPSRL